MSYQVFVRNWWIRDSSAPDGRAPGPGRKTILRKHVETESQARQICQEYNESHDPGFLSRKAEYMSN